MSGEGQGTDTSGESIAPTPDEALGYEQARDELLEVVRRLEAGGVTLEQSLALWERGEQLATVCQQWLDGARARLDAAVRADEAQQGPEAGQGHDMGTGSNRP